MRGREESEGREVRGRGGSEGMRGKEGGGMRVREELTAWTSAGSNHTFT